MSILKDRFNHVFYVPGNHDLWCHWEGEDYLDSLEKLNKLLDACKALGVEINPMVINELGIIPLFSWYHESFDKEKNITSIRILSLEMDFHACKWPKELSSGDTSLTLYLDEMNEINQSAIKEVQKTCTQTITFSHFVPRQELCPEKRMRFYPKLPKIIVSDSLELRISKFLFGNKYFSADYFNVNSDSVLKRAYKSYASQMANNGSLKLNIAIIHPDLGIGKIFSPCNFFFLHVYTT
ncbi:hypothetical protein UlMin_032738 [Ulmus minor]